MNKWIGSFRLGDFLNDLAGDQIPRPPDLSAVYLFSLKPWRDQPTDNCGPLYVGSITGKTPRFKIRMGDTIIDMLGFFTPTQGRSSGGQSLYKYCLKGKIAPLNLYVGWYLAECHRCIEGKLFRELKPILNRNSPPKCGAH